MPGLSLIKLGAAVAFAPVSVVSEASDEPPTKPIPTPSLPPPAQPSSAAPPPTPKRRSGAVEIRLANGRVIKVDEGIAPNALARLLAVGRWRPLVITVTAYVDHGQLEISNNAAENAIRSVALGRNYAQVRIMRSCRTACAESPVDRPVSDALHASNCA